MKLSWRLRIKLTYIYLYLWVSEVNALLNHSFIVILRDWHWLFYSRPQMGKHKCFAREPSAHLLLPFSSWITIYRPNNREIDILIVCPKWLCEVTLYNILLVILSLGQLKWKLKLELNTLSKLMWISSSEIGSIFWWSMKKTFWCAHQPSKVVCVFTINQHIDRVNIAK